LVFIILYRIILCVKSLAKVNSLLYNGN